MPRTPTPETLRARAFLRIAQALRPSPATRSLQRRPQATASALLRYLRIARGQRA